MFPFEGEMAITMAVNGASGHGKTFFCLNLIKNHKEMFPDQEITNFVICYNEWQPEYSSVRPHVPTIKFIHGLISREELDKFGQDRKFTLIFFDDLMTQLSHSATFLDSVLCFSHHKRINLIFSLHNIFYQGKYSRTLALNTKYITLFTSRRDVHQMQTLATQIWGSTGSKAILEAFQDAKRSSTYAYLLIDLSPHMDATYTLRTKIFPGETTIVYVFKEMM